MTNPRPTTSAAQPLDQPHRRRGRATGGQHVVDDQHPLAREDGVAVDLQLVGAVLEHVLLAGDRPRQLARPCGPGTNDGPDPVGDGRGQDEAAGLDADHPVDGDAGEVVGDGVDGEAERVGVGRAGA